MCVCASVSVSLSLGLDLSVCVCLFVQSNTSGIYGVTVRLTADTPQRMHIREKRLA